MPLENVLSDLRSVRSRTGGCTSIHDLARQLASYQRIVEQVIDEISLQINNIINTGGGATTPVYVIRARVNQVGGVPAAQATFNFDDVTDAFTYNGEPSGVTSGTAQNIEQRYMQDNEVVILTSFNGTIWLADKVSENVITASVNKPGGVITTDATFEFDGAVARLGVAPAGGIGTAINVPATAYADNETVLLFQDNAGAWRVAQDDDDLGGGGGGSYSAGFAIDGTKLSTISTIELDRRTVIPNNTLYDPEREQVAAHGAPEESNRFKWVNLDVIEIDLSA